MLLVKARLYRGKTYSGVSLCKHYDDSPPSDDTIKYTYVCYWLTGRTVLDSVLDASTAAQD